MKNHLCITFVCSILAVYHVEGQQVHFINEEELARSQPFARPRVPVQPPLSHVFHDPLLENPLNPYYDPDFDQTPLTSDQDWSEWTEWSFCSRSCGGGVAMRTRGCGIRSMNDLKNDCLGEDVQHRICSTQSCSGNEEDFRTSQCARHNHRQVFSSTQFKWVPYYGSDIDPCQLNCIAEGFNFYKTFGSVQDGTRCYGDQYDVCIEGKCKRVGCDLILGSNLTVDACGVCGGRNTTCFHYSKTFDELPPNTGNFEYNQIATIPAGATDILITDSTNNYLAVQVDNEGYHEYVFNGDNVISWPGNFPSAGTIIKYTRTEDDETVSIQGPTTSDLYIQMLYLGDLPMVKYEYRIPHHVQPPQEQQQLQVDYRVEEPDSGDIPPSWIVDIMGHDETTPPPTTTTTEATTTTATTTTTTTTTPMPTTLPRPRRNKKNKPPYCVPCKKPKNRKRHYCQSDFVIHARVLSKSKVEGKRYRHDVTVLSIFKSDFKLMSREYVWVYSSCCPKFRAYRDYLIMGRKRRVEIGNDGRGIWLGANNGTDATDGRRRFETRLMVDHMDFWHVWKRKYLKGLNKVANSINCSKYKRHATSLRRRDPESRRRFSRRRAGR
uniref:ADAMTS-like protein 5 n=1 Tax=Ciona intestinalis TaxID=7719 RepID=UPI000180BC70|nr:ADAMTS-like protein 5 [Ciona intestinalis]XP_026690036.1 ADAMTS-like protein 5 [Ciona intestinalis]XP_026690037.1 ADAMTS-like protein 5 [Ciona intestinalis]|eukprot:XP_018667203.1 ADAMTS-like protein 5 [Ciona intestinalis]